MTGVYLGEVDQAYCNACQGIDRYQGLPVRVRSFHW
jgi:hypothetical protein